MEDSCKVWEREKKPNENKGKVGHFGNFVVYMYGSSVDVSYIMFW